MAATGAETEAGLLHAFEEELSRLTIQELSGELTQDEVEPLREAAQSRYAVAASRLQAKKSTPPPPPSVFERIQGAIWGGGGGSGGGGAQPPAASASSASSSSSSSAAAAASSSAAAAAALQLQEQEDQAQQDMDLAYAMSLEGTVSRENSAGGGGGGGGEGGGTSPRWACTRCTAFNSMTIVECKYCGSVVEYPESWSMDEHSAHAFGHTDEHFFGGGAKVGGGGGGGEAVSAKMRRLTEEMKKKQQAAAREASRVVAQQGAGADLRHMASHSQNVHSALVEGEAYKTIEELLGQPLPPGMKSEAAMIADCKEALKVVKPQTNATLKAYTMLNDEGHMGVEHNGHTYKEVLSATWNVILRHKDKVEMTRRLSEEISESEGVCPGGRIGRLINSLRGFVDVGIESADGASEAFRIEFGRRVVELPEGTPLATRKAEAEAVLSQYGIQGKARTDWLAAVDDM